MQTDNIRKPLFNKPHIFEPGALVCSRCGATVMEARNTPFRCIGAGDFWGGGRKPLSGRETFKPAGNS